MSAEKKEQELSFYNETSAQIRPNKKEQPLEPEEFVYEVENIEQGIRGQPSSLATCNSKSATQTVLGNTEGSRQSSEQLRSSGAIATPNSLQSVTDTASDLLDENELLPILETLSIASPPINQSTTDTSLELLDDSEQLPMKLRTLGVKPVEAPSISSLSNLQSASDFLDLSKEFPLTLQQREAISRRHHLKFITGHYGSGKVIVSYP